MLPTSVLGPHLRKHRPHPPKKILYEAQQFLRQANQFYLLRPRLLAADAAECRTLLLIGRRRVGSRQSVEQAEQAERLSGACSTAPLGLGISSSPLHGSQHEHPVEASPVALATVVSLNW